MLDVQGFEKISDFLGFFEKISSIPRGSGNCEQIAKYLVSFAKERGLYYMRDSANNVIIKKAATEGYEDHSPIILQAHTDMVIAVEEGFGSDILKNGVTLVRDGDFLHADGTTLGGDDGIGVAYILAILNSDTISHPAIEALFTADEEIGLIGADMLDYSNLCAKRMINLDIGHEGLFVVGCAGGRRADVTLPLTAGESVSSCYSLNLFGLTGGHSGGDINKGRVNAIIALADCLKKIKNVRLVSFSGGDAGNAIPRSASARFVTDMDEGELCEIITSHFKAYDEAESELDFRFSEITGEMYAFCAEDSKNALDLIINLPCGVVEHEEAFPTRVKTSLSLGVAALENGALTLTYELRSSSDLSKEALAKILDNIATSRGASVEFSKDYPGWEYTGESELISTMRKTYSDMYGDEPKVITIHAGLECGIFSDAIEGLECVAMGPDNYNIHTTAECAFLPSVERVYDYLKKVLESL